jgi:acyl-CoA reductase-like NAD-dependent aldehyde dehydrogenase
MSQPYQVVQAYDRALIKEIPADDAAALEAKLETAWRLMKDRDGALKPYQRNAILIRAAELLGERLDAFAWLIAQEGGKPLTDAKVEAIRAVDGLRNAA